MADFPDMSPADMQRSHQLLRDTVEKLSTIVQTVSDMAQNNTILIEKLNSTVTENILSMTKTFDTKIQEVLEAIHDLRPNTTGTTPGLPPLSPSGKPNVPSLQRSDHQHHPRHRPNSYLNATISNLPTPDTRSQINQRTPQSKVKSLPFPVRVTEVATGTKTQWLYFLAMFIGGRPPSYTTLRQQWTSTIALSNIPLIWSLEGSKSGRNKATLMRLCVPAADAKQVIQTLTENDDWKWQHHPNGDPLLPHHPNHAKCGALAHLQNIRDTALSNRTVPVVAQKALADVIDSLLKQVSESEQKKAAEGRAARKALDKERLEARRNQQHTQQAKQTAAPMSTNDPAGSAARDITGSATRDTIRGATRDAVGAARNAAGGTARDATGGATNDDAGDAANDNAEGFASNAEEDAVSDAQGDIAEGTTGNATSVATYVLAGGAPTQDVLQAGAIKHVEGSTTGRTMGRAKITEYFRTATNAGTKRDRHTSGSSIDDDRTKRTARTTSEVLSATEENALMDQDAFDEDLDKLINSDPTRKC